MLLQLNEEVLAAKGLHIPAQALVGLPLLALIEQLGHLSTHTARGRNKPFGMGREEVVIDARLVIVAVELRVRGNLEQVAVAGEVLRQQQEVIILLVQLAIAPAHGAAPLGLVGFHAQQRLNACIPGGA